MLLRQWFLIGEIEKTHHCYSSDIVARGYGYKRDCLSISYCPHNIITNPPFKYNFPISLIHHAHKIMDRNKKLALFLPVRYLAGIRRKNTFEQYPPQTIWVMAKRPIIFINGNRVAANAVDFAWYVWQIGSKHTTRVEWI